MPEFISWILLGLFAGSLAKIIMPGDQKGGCLMTIILGIVGSSVGGMIGSTLNISTSTKPGTWLPSLSSILCATAGAFVILLIFRLIFGGKK